MTRNTTPDTAAIGSPHAPDTLMTLDEVCEFLRISIGTARKQRAEGKFVPGYRLGKHLRFRQSAVQAWLEHHADDHSAF